MNITAPTWGEISRWRSAEREIYAFLPRLTGREWYSATLANSHLVLTVVGGYGMVLPMLVQGLQGAPRRYAVLPSRFDALTQLTIPFVIMTALGQIVFA